MSDDVTCPECGKEYDTPRGFLSHWGQADDGNHEGGAPKEAYGELEFSEEHRENISENRSGISHSEETKQKIAEAVEGHDPWNKGLTKEESESLRSTAESLRGRTRPDEVVERHAEAVREAWGRGAYDDREIDFPAGKDHPHYRHGKFVGEKRPDYPAEFSHRLREKMREQQDRKCAVCGERSNQHLDVHHINGDKHNNTPENLVALCRTCHMNMEHTSQEVQELLYSTGTDPEWTLNDRVVV